MSEENTTTEKMVRANEYAMVGALKERVKEVMHNWAQSYYKQAASPEYQGAKVIRTYPEVGVIVTGDEDGNLHIYEVIGRIVHTATLGLTIIADFEEVK